MDSVQAEQFKVLGVESRIRIIELLKQKGSLCVSKLSDALGITPSAVSQHLKVLKQAGLVRNERKGYWIHYRLDPVALQQCKELLSEVCTCGCKGTGRIREAALSRAKDPSALLRKYERQLQKELKEVRSRIKAMGSKTSKRSNTSKRSMRSMRSTGSTGSKRSTGSTGSKRSKTSKR